MASLSIVPSGYNSTYSSYKSITNAGNANTDHTSTTYATIGCTTGSRASTYFSLSFNVSSVPSDATIDSVSCVFKARVSSTSYISTATGQLYNNDTAMGSSVSCRSTSTSTTYTISSPGSWTRSTLDNLLLRITATRGTSNTTRSASLYVYGATLTIAYTENRQKYVVTITASGPGSVDPTGAQNVMEGDSLEVAIYPDQGAGVSVKDNNVDKTGSLEERTAETSTSAPIGSYETSGSISGTYYRNATGQGYDTTSTSTNNDYCSSSGSTAYISYSFDLSAVPAGATIKSVTCKAKGHCESTSASNEVARLQLYSGTTAKGSSVDFTSTSNNVVDVNGGSSWTRAELDNIALRFTIGYYGGAVLGATIFVEYETAGGSKYYVYTLASVSGAHTIAVVFTEAGGTGVFVKIDGSWKEAAAIFRKVSGSWVQIGASDIDTAKKYRHKS